MFCIKFRPVSLRVTSAHFSQRFWGGCFTCGLFCTYLRPCRKPEALWEAALASRVVPEGGGPLPALPEGTRAWGGDPAQATHQAGLVFLETPVLVSACLLKGVLHWHLTFTWATVPMKTQTNPAPPVLHFEVVGLLPPPVDKWLSALTPGCQRVWGNVCASF